MNASVPTTSAGPRSGFSLIEVTLALLVFISSIFVIFALVPNTLEMSRESVNSTEMALYAESVMPAMRANAATIESESDWRNANAFEDIVKRVGFPLPEPNMGPEVIEFPVYSDPQNENRGRIRAALDITRIDADPPYTNAPPLWGLTLYVDGSAYGAMVSNTFYTEVVFMGEAE